MSALEQFVGWFSLPVLPVLVGILLWRRISREFPHFLNYIAVNGLVGFVRLWAYGAGAHTYAVIYWISDVLISVFALLATYELFIRRLFPRFSSVRLYQFLFPTAAVIIVLVSVPSALEAHKSLILKDTIHILDTLRVTILIFFIGLMVFMGRRWTRYEFGIASGLVVEASSLLTNSTIWSQRALVAHYLEELPVIAFDLACIIWIITFLKPEKPTAVPSVPIGSEVLPEARKWQEAAKGSVTGKTDPD